MTAAPTGSGPGQDMARAMEWVAKITTIALEMVLPGLAGQWLDQRLGTNGFVLLGFVLGISGAIWHLIAITAPRGK